MISRGHNAEQNHVPDNDHVSHTSQPNRNGQHTLVRCYIHQYRCNKKIIFLQILKRELDIFPGTDSSLNVHNKCHHDKICVITTLSKFLKLFANSLYLSNSV